MALRALKVDAGLSLDECASLPQIRGLAMGLRRRRRRTRRRRGRGRSGDPGVVAVEALRLPLPVLDRATEWLDHDGERVPLVLLLLGDISESRAEQRGLRLGRVQYCQSCSTDRKRGGGRRRVRRKRFFMDHIALRRNARRHDVAMV